ncbi:hypothetical protein BKA80DRAFT_280523 [Phyllosticta citrichinensis]
MTARSGALGQRRRDDEGAGAFGQGDGRADEALDAAMGEEARVGGDGSRGVEPQGTSRVGLMELDRTKM